MIRMTTSAQEAATTQPVAGGVRPRLGRNLFTFPDPVNELSARLVAGGVVMMSALTPALALRWGPAVIAYGFVARVAAGPRFSPLGQLVTRLVTPRLRMDPALVPGPPKRFAQGIGALITVSSAVLAGLGFWTAAQVVLGFVVVAATLESVFALCMGCKLFALLMRLGVIPASVCERCNTIAA
jgi:hypothetical protein